MSMRLPLDARIYVAGHDSPLGHMLCRKLQATGHRQVITRSSHELNLRNQLDVNLFFEQELPDYVFLINDHSAGQVDQVVHPAEFLYGRLLGLSNVIHASYVYEVSKLLNIICTVGDVASAPTGSWAEGEPQSEPSTEALIEMVTLGLCDRYRKQYGCDFITARLHINAEALSIERTSPPAPPSLSMLPSSATGGGLVQAKISGTDELYSLDPTDACLFLMEHFSSTGAISVRSGVESFVVP